MTKESIFETINLFSYAGLTDKTTVHSYGEFYSGLLVKYINKPVKILEIGVDKGGFLTVLSKIFPNGQIYGLDHTFVRFDKSLIRGNMKLVLADQNNEKIIDSLPEFDIIIDDASHNPEKTIKSFEIFSSCLKAGGIYIIEDVQYKDLKFYRENPKFSIFDFRSIKNRFDDILITYTKQ